MKYTKSTYSDLSNCIRVLTIDAVEKAKSGHPGMPMGMADVATILYSEFLRFNPNDPKWSNRDRLVLSAGHGSMLLYSLLYLTGYKDFNLDEIKDFRQLNSITSGHPEYGNGVEVTTGPLGQGIGNAIGIALAAKMSNARLKEDVLDYKTYVISGDGCLMEGISHESASLAGHLALDNLVLLFDDNGITIDGKKDLAESDNVLDRFRAYNWEVYQIDGHDYDQIHDVLTKAQSAKKPVFISCKTTIGYGSPNKGGTEKCHGAPLGKYEAELAKQSYNWKEGGFFIPESLLKIWRDEIGMQSYDYYRKWQKSFEDLTKQQKMAISSINHDSYLDHVKNVVFNYKKSFIDKYEEKATRSFSGDFLDAIANTLPLCGGSADLSGSNCSKAKDMSIIKAHHYSGNYIHYGIREHAMGAVMNGLAVCGNMYVYGSTFLVFQDYMKPAMRMAALMELPVTYVMTHDSIGVGEDGPTHQPIEQIASLRVIPNLNVFRPADATEVFECWQLALASKSTPSVLCLTRQKVKQVRFEYSKDNLSQKGGYILVDSSSNPEIVILSSGSEVTIALEVKHILVKHKIAVRIISVPSFDLLAQQDQHYIDSIIPRSSKKVVIEAASRFGWERFAGSEAMFFCIDQFGKSAPSEDLFDYFGLNADNISKKILNNIRG